jgi:hypothetical protein
VFDDSARLHIFYTMRCSQCQAKHRQPHATGKYLPLLTPLTSNQFSGRCQSVFFCTPLILSFCVPTNRMDVVYYQRLVSMNSRVTEWTGKYYYNYKLALVGQYPLLKYATGFICVSP